MNKNKIILLVFLVALALLISQPVLAAKAAGNKEVTEQPVTFWSSIGDLALTFWGGFWQELKTTIQDVIRQVFESVHKTFALVFMMWLLKKAENKAKEMRPSITNFVDKYSANIDMIKKRQIADYISDIIFNNIRLVEASFQRQINPEDATIQNKIEQSKQKMSAALVLIFNDIIKDGMEESVFGNKDKDTQVKHMLLEVEKSLNNNSETIKTAETRKDMPSTGVTDVTFLCATTNKARIKSLIGASSSYISNEYLVAIDRVLGDTFIVK